MNVFQRMGLAASILIGRRPAKAAAAAFMSSSWQHKQPSYVMQGDFASLVEQGYYKNELIFACIVSTADSASQISLAVRKKKDRSLVTDHPLLDLIHKPNDEMNEFDLWSSAITFQKTAGRALYEKVRDRAGRVFQLQPLRPDWMKVMPGVTRRIGEYFYQPPGTQGAPLRPEDVLDIKHFDPLLRYSTKSPLAVLCRAGDVDNAITDFIKLFFENGGAPPGAFLTSSDMDDDDVAAARRRYRERYGGYRNWIDPMFISGEDIKYQQTGSSFKDMGFETLDERDEARICAVLGVPPIIVGARIGLKEATYSNYAQARKAWWEDKLSPMYVNYLDVIGRLMDEMDPSGEHYVDWDFSQVKAFQEENNERWRRATEALRSGAITRNEFNAEVGLPGIGPRGDVYLMPLNIYEAPKKTLAKPPEPTTQPADTTAPADDADEDATDDAADTNGDKSLQSKANMPADAEERAKAEREMAKAMGTYFSGQFDRIKAAVARAGIGLQ